jgi:hypothetical protein
VPVDAVVPASILIGGIKMAKFSYEKAKGYDESASIDYINRSLLSFTGEELKRLAAFAGLVEEDANCEGTDPDARRKVALENDSAKYYETIYATIDNGQECWEEVLRIHYDHMTEKGRRALCNDLSLFIADCIVRDFK